MSESNADEYKLFWGDVHGHSGFSIEAVGDADKYYEYAFNDAGLSFAALTDHDHSLNRRKWEKIQRVAEQYNNPGYSTTFMGYEWTSPVYGHKTVLFPGSNVPSMIFSHRTRSSRSPAQLWEQIRRYNGITIAHHSLANSISTDWEYHDGQSQPLVEIYSKMGNSEYPGARPALWKSSRNSRGSVREALAMGHRLGFIAGSDTHCARPGSVTENEFLTHRYFLRHPAGLTGVWATGLDRAAIWQAFIQRRVYAVVRTRITAHFSMHGHWMGEEVITDKTPVFRVKLQSPCRIMRVEFIRNNNLMCDFLPETDDWATDIADESPPMNKTNFYFVRCQLENGDQAWLSPIWVTRSV